MIKIIDAFTFAGELDLLELRLNELDSVVDHFVIVEAAEPHAATGRRQPTYLAEPERWAEVTSKFGSKIVYNVLDKLEPPYTDRISGWKRENLHQSSLWEPSLQLSTSPEDWLLVSSVDEIPSANMVSQLHKEDFRKMFPDEVVYLGLDLFYHNVNNYFDKRPWTYSHMGTIKAYTKIGGTLPARANLDAPQPISRIAVYPAGWHLTSFMDLPRLREKLHTFAHSSDSFVLELLKLNDKELASLILSHKNIFDRSQLVERASDDPRLPKYLLDNPEKFAHFHEKWLREKYS